MAVAGDAESMKSVTMTVYGITLGCEKLTPLFETLICTVSTPIGHDRFACSPSPIALPAPQLPVHFIAVRGHLLGSEPAPFKTIAAPLVLVALAV
jgi:hypothetical protein